MKQSLRVYAAVLRLVRLLPSETRSYYARFARENFASYRDEDDAGAMANLFDRSYQHSCWILTKYGVDTEKADNLKQICKSLS